jgi:hypothetical protein
VQPLPSNPSRSIELLPWSSISIVTVFCFMIDSPFNAPRSGAAPLSRLAFAQLLCL